ncbi:hypothetical protein [Clostridium minihomine]|uniref:hypothetical protein n=1 Tax=Clostridium minihomine TaxID=2045012 RepID=UPI0013EDAF86|nr:hypothetical protein [Clostridium minihomine]
MEDSSMIFDFLSSGSMDFAQDFLLVPFREYSVTDGLLLLLILLLLAGFIFWFFERSFR